MLLLFISGMALAAVLAEEQDSATVTRASSHGRVCTFNQYEDGGVSWSGWESHYIFFDKDCTEIDLASWSFHFGNTGAQGLATALRESPNKIDTLSLAYNRIQADGMESLTEVLGDSTMPHLAHLDLQGNDGLGARGLNALASSLARTYMLRSLNLSATGLNDASLEVLAAHMSLPPRLAVLSLNHNDISDTGVSTLAVTLPNMHGLDSLYLAANNISDFGVRQLAAALAKKPRMIRLDLSAFGEGSDSLSAPDEQHLGPDATAALANMLKNTPYFEDLSLNGRGIGDDGLRVIASSLEHTPKLKRLGLQSNGIGDRGAEILARALPSTPQLTRLDLSWNSIGQDGASAIAEAMAGMPGLRELRLKGHSNHIGKKGLKSLAAALGNTPYLVDLSVHSLGIGPHFEDLAVGLASVRRLEKLSLWSDSITHAGAEALARAAANMPNLMLIDLTNVTMSKAVSWAFADLMLSHASAGNKMFNILGLDGDTFEHVRDVADSTLAATVRYACGEDLAAAGAERYLAKALGTLGATMELAFEGLKQEEISTDLKDAGIPTVARNSLAECFVKIGKAASAREDL